MVDGKFSLSATVGAKKVEIVGVRSKISVSGKKEDVETEENDIPDRYNQKTELVAEVTGNSNSDKFEFALKSKP
ncbi:MAG: hypothetical protein JWM11_6974 [Planctomycetaceae bacterium]|nr:hypothetical protein [Planctomycetaceae bacterium]